MLVSAVQQQHKSPSLLSLQYFLSLFSSLHPWGHLPLQTLVYCHLSLHGPTLWNQMKFLQLSRQFLAPCLCSCCSPTWNAPLPSFGYFFFKTEVRHYLIHCLPRKKWTEHLLRDTMSGPHLGNHRCSGFSWAGVLMFRMSGQQEGTLGDRGCPPPSGSFPCSSSQAEASTSLRCLRHALYYAATAANP